MTTKDKQKIIEAQAAKRAIDHFQTPIDKLHEIAREWCYYQAQKDLEVK